MNDDADQTEPCVCGGWHPRNPLCMLAEEVRLLKEQRRKLWMLLDDIDTLDDSCRDNDNAFRQAARKRQRQRFEIWNPDDDIEVMSVQQRFEVWVERVLGPEATADARERSLRAVEEVIELAQVCGVQSEVLHRLVDYVFARPVGEAAQEVAGSLLTVYGVATALGVNANKALEAELERVQKPEVMEKVRKRQLEKREALVGDVE